MAETGPTERVPEASPEASEGSHVLVVDDDNRLRDLLRRFLGENGYRVTTAGSAAEARAHLAGMAFDILVGDVMMPGESGTELTRALRETSDIPILLLTAMAEPEERINGLECGADDYLTKPFEPRELLLRLTSILRRTHTAAPAAQRGPVNLGACVFDLGTEELTREGAAVKLTRTEGELLSIFAGRPNVTLSRDELCEQVGADPAGRALDVQITRLRRKIEPDPRDPRYLQTVWGAGYVLRPD